MRCCLTSDAAPANESRPTGLRLGRVIARAGAGLRARWGLMLGAGLVLGGPPHVIGLYLMIGQPFSRGWDYVAMPAAWLVQGVLAGLLYGLAALVLTQQSRGLRAGAGSLWRELLRRAFPVAAATGLAWLATRAALLLLVIPGLVLGPFLCLAAPIAAVEGRGPLAALRRSWVLGRGSRWALAGVMLLMLAAHLVGLALLVAPLVLLRGEINAESITGVSILSPVLTGILTAPLAALLLASAYVELVTLKEGGAASHLAEVFA